MLGLPSQFELARPSWLLGLALVPLVAWYFRRSLVGFPRIQRIVSLSARSIIVALLVLSLAGLTWMTTTKRKYIVFAVDRSLSVGEDSRKAGDDYLKRAMGNARVKAEDARPVLRDRRYGDGDAVGYLAFAAEPGQFRPGGITGPAPSDDKGTDLAAAIEVAASSIPPGYNPEIVVLSDGNSTTGDALKAALRSGIPSARCRWPVATSPRSRSRPSTSPRRSSRASPSMLRW